MTDRSSFVGQTSVMVLLAARDRRALAAPWVSRSSQASSRDGSQWAARGTPGATRPVTERRGGS